MKGETSGHRQWVRDGARWTATATRCWCWSTRRARPATPASAAASTGRCRRSTGERAHEVRRHRPDREEFAALAGPAGRSRSTRRLLADSETAVGVYRKLAGNRPGTVLLESAEQGKRWSRYSFVGRAQRRRPHRAGRRHAVAGRRRARASPTTCPADPLAAVRTLARRLRSPRTPGLPPLTGGLVGYLGYDVVRRLERLPETSTDDLGMPELAMMLVTDLAVLDHTDGIGPAHRQRAARAATRRRTTTPSPGWTPWPPT